jgi:ABC-2 type transport system permease protein
MSTTKAAPPARVDTPIEPRNEPSQLDLVKLVALREMSTRLRDKTFVISTIFLILIVAASVAIPMVVASFDGRDQHTVAVVGAPAERVATRASALGQSAFEAAEASGEESSVFDSDFGVPQAEITVKPVEDVAAAESAVGAGTVDAALVSLSANATAEGADLVLIGDSDVPTSLTDLVTRAVAAERLDAALTGTGADAAEVGRALAADPPQERLLDPDADQHGIAVAVGVIFSLLFFLTVFSFGMSIAQSITEEKQSRIVEILVTAVPPRSLLLGKVLGNTALALGQIAVLLAVGFAGAAVAGQSDVVSILLRSSGWFALFFVIGFLMLATLWAAAGALASRQEDLQATTMPLQLLIMGPFFASVYVTEPGTWMTVLSYIPLSSPLMMPRRIALGDAQWWEVLLSVGIVLATAALLIAVGARIYSNSLMQTRSKVAWLAAWSRAE